MPDYKKMYVVLCGAIDKAINPLEQISEAEQISKSLKDALIEAEEIYIKTASYLEETGDPKIVELKVDIENEK